MFSAIATMTLNEILDLLPGVNSTIEKLQGNHQRHEALLVDGTEFRNNCAPLFRDAATREFVTPVEITLDSIENGLTHLWQMRSALMRRLRELLTEEEYILWANDISETGAAAAA